MNLPDAFSCKSTNISKLVFFHPSFSTAYTKGAPLPFFHETELPSSEMEQTDCKPYQPLSKVKHEMDLAYTSSSDESEDGRKPRQSYNSRETLHEYNQELRMNYSSQSRTRKEVEKSTQGMFLLDFYS